MVPRISRSLHASAILAAVLTLLVPQAVRADLEVTFQQDAGPVTMVADNPVDFDSVFFNGTFGKFKVTVFGAASDNGTPTSDLMSSTTAIKNTDTVAHTITIGVTQDNYTLPGVSGTLLDMTSHIGGTVTTGGVGQTLTFQSYANNSNGLFDITTPVVATTGPQSPDISVTKSSFDSMPDPSAAFPRTSGLYSVTTYNKITLAPGGVINFSTTTTLELPAATPAPASLVLALTALPALGLGTWVRRRLKKTVTC
jgi:hypothetical protein